MFKLSIKAPGKMMMVSKLTIGKIKACGFKGWPREARLSSMCKGGSKQERGNSIKKCAFFDMRRGSHGCKLESFGGKKRWPKGGAWLEYEAP